MASYLLRIVFLLFSLFPLSGTAQLKKYLNQPREDGYVVTLSGDTLHGYIYYERNKQLFTKIRFQKSLDDQATQFNPSEIRAFYMADTRQLFVSGDLLQTYKRGNPAGSEGVFLRVLVKGSASLYEYSALAKPKYYATNHEAAEFLDKGRETSKHINGRVYKINEKPYLQSLQKMFSDCIHDTLTVRYTEYELVGIFENYNQCVHSKSNNYVSRKRKLLLGVTVGYLSSNLTFSDKNTETRPYGYSSFTSPYGTYDLSLLLKQEQESASYFGGLSMSIFFGDNKHFSYESQLIYTQRAWNSSLFKIDLKYIEIPIAFQYNFRLRGAVQPTVGAGVDVALNISSKLESADQTWDFHKVTYTTGSGGIWPDVLPVIMPAIYESEFKPSMLIPTGNIGFDVVGKNSVVAFSYKIGFPSSITKSPLYKTSVSHQMISVTYSANWW